MTHVSLKVEFLAFLNVTNVGGKIHDIAIVAELALKASIHQRGGILSVEGIVVVAVRHQAVFQLSFYRDVGLQWTSEGRENQQVRISVSEDSGVIQICCVISGRFLQGDDWNRIAVTLNTHVVHLAIILVLEENVGSSPIAVVHNWIQGPTDFVVFDVHHLVGRPSGVGSELLQHLFHDDFPSRAGTVAVTFGQVIPTITQITVVS